MSVSTWKRAPSSTRPMATPATGALIGTPASISDRLVPHTLAIELEPLDSRISETTRIVYGKVVMSGITAFTPRRARLPWPISRRFGEPIMPVSPRERREVVVQHERLAPLALEGVDDLRIAGGAERGDDQRLGLAAGEERRAVSARQHADSHVDGTHGARIAAVDTRLTVEDALAHDGALELEEDVLDGLLAPLRRLATGQRRDRRRLDLAEARMALLLLGDAVGGGERRIGLQRHRGGQPGIIRRRLPLPALLARFARERFDRADGALHLLVAEDH